VQAGARTPRATVFDHDLHPVEIESLAAEGPFLLTFYLYDWTET
jgi:hypothetical protein